MGKLIVHELNKCVDKVWSYVFVLECPSSTEKRKVMHLAKDCQLDEAV